MNTMLPFLLMEGEEDGDNLLLLVLMNSMSGGLDSSEGFSSNFNMLLPLLMGGEDEGEYNTIF